MPAHLVVDSPDEAELKSARHDNVANTDYDSVGARLDADKQSFDTHLAENENEKYVLNAKSFGLKSGDSNFDNSPILLNIIQQAKSTGITKIIIPPGYYTFKTPIYIDYLEKIVFEGQGEPDLIYDGTGYFITADSCVNVKFSDLSFVCSATNNAFNLTGEGTVMPTNLTFDYVYFYNGDIPVRFGWIGYLYLNNCNWGYTITSQSFGTTRLLFDHNSKGNACEYTYLKHCNLDGTAYLGNGLVYHGGQFHYITECDIPNWKGAMNAGNNGVDGGVGVLLNPAVGYEINNVYISKTSFLRTTFPLITDSSNALVRRVYFSDNFISMSDDAMLEPYSRQYKNIGTSTQYIMLLRSNIVRNNNPTYDYELTGALNVSISEYGETFMPKFLGDPQLFTQLNNNTIAEFDATINNTLNGWGVTFNGNNLTIDRAYSPEFFKVDYVGVNLTDIKPYSTGSSLTLYAVQNFIITPSSTFCANKQSGGVIPVNAGQTVVLKQISPIKNWTIQSIS